MKHTRPISRTHTPLYASELYRFLRALKYVISDFLNPGMIS